MVLIGYDGSPTAKRAIPVAHAILGDKPATVLYVWQAPSEFLSEDWMGAGIAPAVPAARPIAELQALALKRAEVTAREGVELARNTGFHADARAELHTGSVWHTIIDVAHDVDAEVIVVGERGLSTVQSVLLGSVSNAVVHHSTVPVLVVPRANAHKSRGAP